MNGGLKTTVALVEPNSFYGLPIIHCVAVRLYVYKTSPLLTVFIYLFLNLLIFGKTASEYFTSLVHNLTCCLRFVQIRLLENQHRFKCK